MSERRPVWFERDILPDLLHEVEAAVRVVGPGTDGRPLAGIEDAEGAMAGALRYDAELMDHAPSLLVIARTGIGVDTVDIAEATTRGIAVCNTPDGPTVSTAEHAIALMLAVAKSIKRSEAELGAGKGNYYANHAAIELDGKTLGLVGFGRIARRVAGAALGLGMSVSIHDPYLDPDGVPHSVTSVADFDDLLATADVVSAHVPLGEDTRGMFDAAAFASMKPGAIFINTARGGLVDHGALLEAVDGGRLHGAGLDVTDPEPLGQDDPLLHRDNVVVTPHVASGTHEGKRRIFRIALAQVVDVVNGKLPAHLVNPEVWDKVMARRNDERAS